uniref:PH domain-containing protein n=1 Tax=Globisporangium ultimum (strain ATCC 200006 / CBS 805.95 / DAOM BR144) TaxID=431595 RepID=K3WHJ9_GLOUD
MSEAAAAASDAPMAAAAGGESVASSAAASTPTAIQNDASTEQDTNSTTAETPVDSADAPATPLEIDIDGIEADAVDDADVALENIIAVTVASESENIASDPVANGGSAESDVVIVEAATPSSVSFETLASPSSDPEQLLGAEAAGAQAEVAVAAGKAEENDAVAAGEVNSDDVLENAQEIAAAESKEDAKAEDETSKEEEGSKQTSETAAADGDAAPKKPKHTNVDEITARVLESVEYESALIRDNGEVLVLPKGWSTRESKTHGGKTYYVSPYGHTQWLRPPLRTGIIYSWIHEIEVSFDYGRLGLNLKQIAGEPGAEFSDLQVHIAEVYKLPNGEPSPAEIYNWGVKPEKRLVVGMRMTAMNGEALTGYTYNEVLEKLSRIPRPVRIKFADIAKGIVGRVKEEEPQEETEEEKEHRVARTVQSSLRLEYFQMLVAYELHQQVWKISRQRIERKGMELDKKYEIVSAQMEALNEYSAQLEKERESLIQETSTLEQTIEQLNLQLEGKTESPEVAKTAELSERNAVLDKEIAEIIAENEELRQARIVVEESLDAVQKELDQYVDVDYDEGVTEIDVFSSAFLGTFVQHGSIDKSADNARDLLLAKIKLKCDQLEGEIEKEEERSQSVESEIYQFHKQMELAAAASKREDDFISGEKPPQFIFLENRIVYLRKTLRETVAAIAKASNDGDHAVADTLSIRRAALKDDLKNALDEMQRWEKELGSQSEADRLSSLYRPSVVEPEEPVGLNIDQIMEERAAKSARLEKKLVKLRIELQETLAEITQASNENDGEKLNALSIRRAELKDEMGSVQDQIRELSKSPSIIAPPITTEKRSDSFSQRPSMSRASLTRPLVTRASLTGPQERRSSITRGELELAERRSSITRQQSELPARRASRSSSDASMASMTQSNDSNANYNPGSNGAMPALSGKLMKHPAHSNEKGMFGNMSIRGFRERWCVIDPEGYLRYYKRKGDKEPRGSIPLAVTGLEIVEGKTDGKPNEFMVCSPTHQTRFAAKNREEMLRWIKTLELAHKILIQNGVSNGVPKSATLRRQESTASNSNAAATAAPAPENEEQYRASRATLGF